MGLHTCSFLGDRCSLCLVKIWLRRWMQARNSEGKFGSSRGKLWIQPEEEHVRIWSPPSSKIHPQPPFLNKPTKGWAGDGAMEHQKQEVVGGVIRVRSRWSSLNKKSAEKVQPGWRSNMCDDKSSEESDDSMMEQGHQHIESLLALICHLPPP